MDLLHGDDLFFQIFVWCMVTLRTFINVGVTPPSHRPGRIFSASGSKNKGLKLVGDVSSIVFKSENSAGMEEITLYFAVMICLFNHFGRDKN